MRFIVNSQTLLKGLQSIGGVIATKSSVPAVENFLFTVEGKKLRVVSSDLETTLMVNVELVESSGDGQIAIPAKIILEALKTFSDLPLVFSYNVENFAIEISAGEGKYKFVGVDPKTYPSMPNREGDITSIELDSSVLANAVNKTFFATGNDPLRPVMAGVYFEFNPDYLNVVATDAHKLVRYRNLHTKSASLGSFILSKKALMQIKNIILAQKEVLTVSMDYNTKNVFFNIGEFSAICLLIDGRYPNYEAVIPKENPYKLTVDRALFLSAIKRISLFSSPSVPQVRFKMSNSSVVVSSENMEVSQEAKERLNCNYDGEPMEIGFNAKYVIEMLSNIDTEEVCFELSSPAKAGLIFPVGGAEEEEVLMLIMPFVLN